MAWMKRTASDQGDLIDQVRAFIVKDTKGVASADAGNTGDGLIASCSASETAVAEVWTVECTTAGDDTSAIFSVTGSVSGASTDLNASDTYDNEKIAVIVKSGDTDFVVGDKLYVTVTTGETPVASCPEYVAGANAVFILTGDGTDEIIMGLKGFTNTTTYWNVGFYGATGYLTGELFDDQPWFASEFICCNGSSFEFYCSFDSYGLIIFASPVEGTHELGTVQWLTSFASPSQWSYPMMVGGSCASASSTIGSTTDRGVFPIEPVNCRVLDRGAVVTPTRYFPRDYGGFTGTSVPSTKLSEVYTVVPIQEDLTRAYGWMRGVRYPIPYLPGGGLLSALSLLGGPSDTQYLTVRNITSGGAGSLHAIELSTDT